jgi:hypothetical protein
VTLRTGNTEKYPFPGAFEDIAGEEELSLSTTRQSSYYENGSSGRDAAGAPDVLPLPKSDA